MSRKKGTPVTVYIDGFNMYHAVESLEKNDLKWLNYERLAVSFLRVSERLEKVYLFTSITPWGNGKKERHKLFIAAQQVYNVEVVEARFKKNRRHCRTQNLRCKFWEEKENDVAISVQMLADAYAGVTKRIILVSADTDQIPAIKHLLQTFRNIEVSIAVPPNRKNEARDMTKLLSRPPIEIDEGRLRACLLPKTIARKKGGALERPESYAQPPP